MGRKISIETVARNFISEYYDADDAKRARLGERIKTVREHMGYSKSELARRAGIDRSMLEKYEKGKCLPKGTTLIKILNALYCDVVEFCRCKQRGKFEAMVERTYVATEENNIFAFKEEVEDRLMHAMSYKTGGKITLVPKDVMETLYANIHAAFNLLEILQYDDEQFSPNEQ